MRNKNEEKGGEEKRVEFVWTLNHDCNYKCPYCSLCFREAVTEKKPFDRETLYFSVEEWVNYWHRIYEKYGSVQIHIVGGEPTIYPSFFDLVRELSTEHYLGFDTNLSCDFNALRNFAAQVDSSRFTFGIGTSFHPCFANFREFIAKVKFLEETGFKIWVNYVAYPPQLKQMAYYKSKVEKQGIHFVLQPFSGRYEDEHYPESYTSEQRDFIKKLVEGNKILEENMEYQLDRKSVKGKLCYAGQKFAYILENGIVKRCGESKSPVIGNLLDLDFKLLSGPTLCNCDTCYCEFKWLMEKQDCEK